MEVIPVATRITKPPQRTRYSKQTRQIIQEMQATDAEIERQRKAYFAKQVKNLTLRDFTREVSRSYTIYSKDTLRNYVQNPQRNEDNLRQLSRFLKRYCMPYKRLINYYAEMPDLNAVQLIPLITSITDLDDPDTIKETYFNTAVKLQQMNLPNELLKLLHVLWLEGSAFGYI